MSRCYYHCNQSEDVDQLVSVGPALSWCLDIDVVITTLLPKSGHRSVSMLAVVAGLSRTEEIQGDTSYASHSK